MATFLSTSENKIDKKGRVSVPSPYRSAIARASHGKDAAFEGIAVYPALGVPCLEGSDLAFFDDIARRIYERNSVVSQNNARLARRLLGTVEQLGFDPEGRVVIPAKLRAYAQIQDKVTFVGIGPKFQIWNPEILLQHDFGADEELLQEAEALGPLFEGGF